MNRVKDSARYLVWWLWRTLVYLPRKAHLDNTTIKVLAYGSNHPRRSTARGIISEVLRSNVSQGFFKYQRTLSISKVLIVLGDSHSEFITRSFGSGDTRMLTMWRGASTLLGTLTNKDDFKDIRALIGPLGSQVEIVIGLSLGEIDVRTTITTMIESGVVTSADSYISFCRQLLISYIIRIQKELDICRVLLFQPPPPSTHACQPEQQRPNPFPVLGSDELRCKYWLGLSQMYDELSTKMRGVSYIPIPEIVVREGTNCHSTDNGHLDSWLYLCENHISIIKSLEKGELDHIC